jgi:hypothetical protein
MLFIRIIFNKQTLNIKEQKHWDGEMLAVISGLNVLLKIPTGLFRRIF